MSRSSTPTASTLVKAAAMALAVPALLLPMKVAAQQMALGGPNFAACEQIKDPAKSAQCTHDATMENLRQRNAAALARSAAADKEGACADQLVSMRNTDPTIVQRGKVILAGRPLKEFGACKLVSELTRS